MLETKDSSIAKATKVLDLLSSDPETVRLSELREKAIWDEVSRINGAIKEREFNIAIKMLDTGSSVEYVLTKHTDIIIWNREDPDICLHIAVQ